MLAAVAQALSQIRPRTNLPHDGENKMSVTVLQPIMEKVFEVPKLAGAKGSSKWVNHVIQRENYTFRDCVDFPEIMRHFVRSRMKEGQQKGLRKGFPILLEKDQVPTTDDIYECHAGMTYRKGATRPHRDVPFFRFASADGAILALKNNCKYLVRVKACDMPNGIEWCNFAEVYMY